MAASIFERPVPEGGGPTAVYCALAILDLDNISDADQNFTLNLFTLCRWSDPREAHDGTGCCHENGLSSHRERRVTELKAALIGGHQKQRSWLRTVAVDRNVIHTIIFSHSVSTASSARANKFKNIA